MNERGKALLNLHALEFKKDAKKKADAKAKIERLRRKVDSSLLRKYEIRKPNYGASSIVPIRGRFCTGCWVSLSLSTRLRAHETLTECEHCARLLYNPARRNRVKMEIL